MGSLMYPGSGPVDCMINGGDGYLYIGTGDGGGAQMVQNRSAATAGHRVSVAHIVHDKGRKQLGAPAQARPESRAAGVAIEMGSAERDKRDEEFEKYDEIAKPLKYQIPDSLGKSAGSEARGI